MPKPLPFYYGWVIVAVTFVCFAIGYTSYHSFSIFYVAILEEFGWSRGATAVAFSCFMIVYGLTAPFVGGLVDRFGPRRIMPLGAIILGIGLLLTTQLSTLWQFYLLFGVVAGLGLGGFGTVPTMTVLNNWFVKLRGTAAGLGTAGIGVGTFLLVPFLQTVISGYGWRTAYVVLAALTMLIVPPVAYFFQRYRPQDMGLLPDGEGATKEGGDGRSARTSAESLIVDTDWVAKEWTLRSAIQTRRYWLILGGRYLELTCMQLFLTHQAAFFVDAGYDKAAAAAVIGTVGIMGSVGKILWGSVSDRIGREMCYTLAFSCGTVGAIVLLSINGSSPNWMQYAYAVIFGLWYGSAMVLLPSMSADIFHGRHFGSVLGGLYVGGGFGQATGAFLGGFIYDIAGSYSWAFTLAIPAMWVACLMYWLAAPSKVRLVAGKAREAAALRVQS